MATVKYQDYQDQSRIYLTQAHEEYGKGDLRQASEKGWGAAVQIVKAAAESRGWSHSSHRELHTIVSGLTEETQDPTIWQLFGNATALHGNSNEGWMNSLGVQDGLEQVSAFVDKIDQLIYGEEWESSESTSETPSHND